MQGYSLDMSDNLADLRATIRAATLEDESAAVERLKTVAACSASMRSRVSARAAALVETVRERSDPGVMESFLSEFGLSTREGVALMCLAEALMRVPDAETVDELIADKIAPHDWGAHIGDSGSLMVNASTWALMLTGRVLDQDDEGIVGALHGALRRLGEPVIRLAVARAMREMASQFVLGRTIREAITRGTAMVDAGFTYSYDMLGEAAWTETDAARYHGAYAQAIAAISAVARSADIRDNPGISIKLSALHPRYTPTQSAAMVPDLSARVLQLARAAKDARIGLNIDAEEAERLDVSLDVIETVLADRSLAGWDGFGVVVQAYGHRAVPVIRWLHALAKRLDRRIMVRLVKGAYWDTEIKRAQVLGLSGFPVFTRKAHTDVSYLACAAELLTSRDRLYPQFATHNAHTVAAVLEMAGPDRTGLEFQRLHGMGEALHTVVRETEGTRCRIYAPVGAHRDLLAYLVRRLLENGANSSFVHQIIDPSVPATEIARDPFAVSDGSANPSISAPSALFGPDRRNSRGWDWTDPRDVEEIDAARSEFGVHHRWVAGSGPASRRITNPADRSDMVGTVSEIDPADADGIVRNALDAHAEWSARTPEARAAILRRAADLYEQSSGEFFALLAREAGKTLPDAIGEIREAVDFLRYYADEAIGQTVPSRGVIVCISPWNFPLAIFTGQIAAALVTGNTVIAKPAEQTPLIASVAIGLLRQAGIPGGVLQAAYGDGAIGSALTSDPRISGVCFTGSTEVAKIIDRQLAETAPDAMLIAETGGINAMVVDSTALPEQAVRDIVASAFQSAGQRCSALRVLFVQKDIEQRLMDMLIGAAEELVVGNPWSLETDVGPVIDADAHRAITAYCADAEERGKLIGRFATPPASGFFVAPTIIRARGMHAVEREIFGPVLHVVAFDGPELPNIIDEINRSGHGLTFGLHTRIDRRVQDLIDTVRVGNFYVNRNQIGAVVGAQPFGGEGLSGTGPKAGGPHYLGAFCQQEEPSMTAPAPRDQSTVVTPEVIKKAASSLDATAWMKRRDRVSVLRGILRGRAADAMRLAASLDPGPIDLDGPTGESNRLVLVPRGLALCLGPTAPILTDQCVQALRAGCAVVAVGEEHEPALDELVQEPLPIVVVRGTIDGARLAGLSDLELGVVTCVGGSIDLRRALSLRDGAIVPLIRNRIEPLAYVTERALCIDTTAAGGNASLMAAADG